MPPLLVGGTVWPEMGPPGRGPLWPPRPACSPRKLRAIREAPVRTPEGGAERLSLNAQVGKASAPIPGGQCGHPEASPTCSLAQMALPWLLALCNGGGRLQEPSQGLPPCSSPPAAPASPT
ncbi:Ankyrin Repeat And Btb/Poz Domain-Containing Protein Btbd11 [Manis pentadactyla]|nr:Ankyrin Repeat And Btb/Poz Domain-Containing Protein Btbd11 [Manis pentadactyla]